MDVDVVDNNVGHVLERETSIACYVDVSSTTVDGFVAVENEFVSELDGHASGEDDPEGFILDDTVTEGSRSWVGGVTVG